MKFENIKYSEKGYMLLESLITLSVIISLIVLFFPMLTDWLALRNDEKNLVEQSRLLYEASMNWPQEQYNETKTVRNIRYDIESNVLEIQVTSSRAQVGVTIDEVEFK